jgi:pimeloyl-ACP methyl ester carboxylesterase
MCLRRSALIDGMRLHWAECGVSSTKPPLVLLHGLNDSHLTWNRLAPLLAADRRVLMPDAPGCGLSDRPDASYQLEWHAHMIVRWLESLGLNEVDLVGHSFGGGVGQRMLLEPDFSIRRLGLIASGGLGPRIAFWLRLAAVPGVVEHLGQPFMAAGTRLALRAAGACMHEQDIAELSEMNAAPGSARALARTVQDVISWRGQSRHFLQRAHEAARLPPIKLFWGDRDTITPYADAVSFAAAVQHVSFEAFEGCGHFLHQEQPAALALRLREFLDLPHPCAVLLPALATKVRPRTWTPNWLTRTDTQLPMPPIATPTATYAPARAPCCAVL